MNCLALSPTNGRTLATGGDDRRINLWIVGQPNALMVHGIYSPGPMGGGGHHHRHCSSGFDVVLVWLLGHGGFWRPFGVMSHSVVSTRLIVPSPSPSRSLLALSPSLPPQSISGITSPVQSVAFNNTENWIGAGSKSGVIKVFDLDENKSTPNFYVCGHSNGDVL